jgi:hydrogenase nickel incorporation protein HypA/HybF
MHELSVTQSILEIALRHGQQAGAHRITDLYLVIGELSSIVDDSVQFYWDFISKDSMAEGARLHFRRIPAELGCRECDTHFSPSEDLACPECGSTRIQVVTGDEFYLESMEVSEAPSPAQVMGASKEEESEA